MLNSILIYQILFRYLFHYISEGGITYMYLANESFGRRVPFVFLQNIQSKLLGTYTISQILDAPDYGINAFNKVIEKQIDFYNNDKNADKLKQV